MPEDYPLSCHAYARTLTGRTQVVSIDGAPWSVEDHLLEPLAMPHVQGVVDRDRLRQAMHQTGAWVARWVDAWDTPPCEWWWMCCDDPDYDMGRLSKQVRYNIRLGLKRCRVERLEAEWFARNGFPVYAAAVADYHTKVSCASAEQFYQEVIQAARYPGRETWGAFIGDKFVAYISCLVIDGAAGLSWGKSDPAFHTNYPNNALIYTLTRHYLLERKYRYATGGARVVKHPTRVQDFLTKMGYRRVYCPLRLELHAVISMGVRMGAPWLGSSSILRRVAPNLAINLVATGTLARIAQSCQTPSPADAP